MPVPFILAALLFLTVPGWAAEGDVFPDLDVNNPSALQEGSRVLEEELKLAARPQTYLLVDLAAGAILIKARGVDLHRLSIATWSASELPRLAGTFRLIARPPVIRRKIDPSATTEQEPISLADMPTEYRLAFSPTMTMHIESSADEGAIAWIQAVGQKVWKRFQTWRQNWGSARPQEDAPTINVTLSGEQAQSLAWSTVDGMAVIIRRPAEP